MKKWREWKMWAHEVVAHGGGFEYHHASPDRQWVKNHGLSEPIVPVVVTESKKGKWLGWIETGTDFPCMIWHENVFEICFAYGSKAEVDRGNGKGVRLEIRKAGES